MKETESMFQKEGIPLFICLGNSPQAQKEWLEQGGSAGHMLSAKQVEAFLMTGAALPNSLAFEGTLAEFIRLFPVQDAEKSRNTVNRFLENGVAEWTGKGWERYTCRTAVLGCCMGEYLSVVNRKEL